MFGRSPAGAAYILLAALVLGLGVLAFGFCTAEEGDAADRGDIRLRDGDEVTLIPVGCTFRDIWFTRADGRSDRVTRCERQGGPPSPTPTSTSTSTPPPATATATATPPASSPTLTPTATGTPSLSPTASPSSTPVPTATPSPTPTPGSGAGVVVISAQQGLGYSNTNPQANTVYRCAPGVVLDGQGSREYAFTGSANNVTVENCIVQNYATEFNGAPIFPRGNGWLIQNNEVRANLHGGIDAAGSNTRVIGNHVHHNGQFGIAGGGGSNLLIQGNLVEHNNQDEHNAHFEAGGGKVTVANGVTWRNNVYRSNNGPEIWADIDVRNALYEGNTVEAAGWPAIMHEVSYDAVIRNNTLRSTGCDDPRGGEWCNVLFLYNSGHEQVTSIVHNNTIVKSGSGVKVWIFYQDRFVDDNPNGELYGNGNWRLFENGLNQGDVVMDCAPEGGLSQSECNAILADIEVEG